jgi:hypothetical protein
LRFLSLGALGARFEGIELDCAGIVPGDAAQVRPQLE